MQGEQTTIEYNGKKVWKREKAALIDLQMYCNQTKPFNLIPNRESSAFGVFIEDFSVRIVRINAHNPEIPTPLPKSIVGLQMLETLSITRGNFLKFPKQLTHLKHLKNLYMAKF